MDPMACEPSGSSGECGSDESTIRTAPIQIEHAVALRTSELQRNVPQLSPPREVVNAIFAAVEAISN